jgi:hypothetical protein
MTGCMTFPTSQQRLGRIIEAVEPPSIVDRVRNGRPVQGVDGGGRLRRPPIRTRPRT